MCSKGSPLLAVEAGYAVAAEAGYTVAAANRHTEAQLGIGFVGCQKHCRVMLLVLPRCRMLHDFVQPTPSTLLHKLGTAPLVLVLAVVHNAMLLLLRK